MPLPVVLHIYDIASDPTMQALNSLLRSAGTGAFHTGVEILGVEYSFNSSSWGTGIETCEPKSHGVHAFRESLEMGESELSPLEVETLLARLRDEWPGNSYDILRRNCCTFSDAFCRELGVGGIPEWVNNLASAAAVAADGDVDGSLSARSASADVVTGLAHDLGEPGEVILEDLTARPPVEVASWALRQLTSLCREGTVVEDLPIFRLAGAICGAPSEQKAALIRSAVEGFGQLPASEKASAIRIGMKGMEVFEQMQQDDRLFWHVQTEFEQLVSGNQRAGPQDQSVDAPPMVQNVLKVAKQLKMSDMAAGEVDNVLHEAQAAVGTIIAEPQGLLGAVTELAPEERAQLADTLVEAQIVPEEQREALEQTVKPGGFADQLSQAFHLLDSARQYWWAFFALPALEMLFSFIFGTLPCTVPAVSWLRVDAILALGVASTVYCSGQTLTPVYQKLRQDPMGAVQRWQALETEDLQQKVEHLLPGIRAETYQAGGVAVLGCAALLLFGTFWAIVGAVQLLGALLLGCSPATALIFLCFVILRSGTVVAVLAALQHLRQDGAFDSCSGHAQHVHGSALP